MGEDLLTSLTIENYQPTTYLSMDPIANGHDESDQEVHPQFMLQPPDINLPLSGENTSHQPQSWNETFEMLEVGLGHQFHESDKHLLDFPHQVNELDKLLDVPHQVNESDKMVDVPSKTSRKFTKRLDSVWGAWFFFTYYFKPVLKEKSKCIVVRDSNGISGFDKTDLQLDVFLVQHDMENMYMWVFKERVENALGKMQLRNYMNGHSRQGERLFPFSVDKGFNRSHRMQRKHYRGLSNPQCVHGIELVPSPNLMGLDEDEQKKWMELTGRDLNFCVPPEAQDFSSWRNLSNIDFELERPVQPVKSNATNASSKKLLNGTSLSFSNHSNGVTSNGVDPNSKKRKDILSNGTDDDCFLPANSDHLVEIHPWMNEFSGVMKNTSGPVTAAKTIYEDDDGYLILVTLPFTDLEKVKVHWWNTPTYGIVKISSVSNACMPFIKRKDRTFKLADPSPEHCPPGEYTRQIPLGTRIPDDAKLEAYFDKSGTILEIKVPKHRTGPEEHEVPILLPPNDFDLS